jgi:hypothetical protein
MAAGRNFDPANPRLMVDAVAKDEKMDKKVHMPWRVFHPLCSLKAITLVMMGIITDIGILVGGQDPPFQSSRYQRH